MGSSRVFADHLRSGRRPATVALVAAVASLLATVAVPTAAAATTAFAADVAVVELVSVGPDGAAGNGPSSWPAVSHDGRRVVFNSFGDNLASGGAGGSQVFLRDRDGEFTAAVSKPAECDFSYTGLDPASPRGSAGFDAISADGRRVVFTSGCPLVSADTNGVLDVYVADVETGGMTLVSVADDSTPGNGNSFGASISADGRHVGFTSAADNLVSGDTNDTDDVFVHDLGPGETSLVSVASDGSRVDSGRYSEGGSLSADGRFVAFHSDGRNFFSDPSQFDGDVHAFVHDRVQGTTTPVSLDTDGVADTGFFPRISADASVVVFWSDEALVDTDSNGVTDVYAFDLATGRIAGRVSVASDGSEANGSTHVFDVSADGRFVAFASVADNLAAVSSSGPHVFRHDRATGETVLVADDADSPSVSADGAVVAFSSNAPLTPEADNGHEQVLVWLDCERVAEGCEDGARVHGTVFDGSRADPATRPLVGVKVELRQDDRVVHGPVATRRPDTLRGEEGPAFYEFPTVAPGEYRLRVTLEDAISEEPVFDVRHGDGATGPAWMEVAVEVGSGVDDIERDVAFHGSEPAAAVSPDLGGDDWPRTGSPHRRDDLAGLFGNMIDYVAWVRENLPGVKLSTAGLALPVEVYAFSDQATRLGAKNAFYRVSDTAIRISRDFSLRSKRDGRGVDVGPTVEWHEFTHHLWRTNVLGTARCPGRGHGGYTNLSTCASLNEGLAAFLPTMALNDLRRPRDPGVRPGRLGMYDAFLGLALESNHLDAWSTVAVNLDGQRGVVWREEFAVAALLWDLVDGDDRFDTESIPVVGAAGVEKVTVGDGVTIELSTLWQVLTKMTGATVRDLRDELHRSGLITDALKKPVMHITGGQPRGEGDDLDLLDVPFLLHGFYPIYSSAGELSMNQLAADFDDTHDAVGRSDSRHPRTGDRRQPRYFSPRVPGAQLRLSVVDPDGRPFPAATAEITFDYPEGTHTVEAALEDDGVTDIYLEPPAYYPGILAEDQALPDCSESDYRVEIAVGASFEGVASDQPLRLDNCTYLQAVASATGEVAVEETLVISRPAPLTPRDTADACPPDTVPEDGFADAAASVHETAIDCLVWWGVTSGQTATTYGPAASVSRAQMATFVAAVLEDAGVALPADPPDAFSDDDDSVHEPAIDRLAALGLIGGTGGGRFGPTRPVSRAQMATFLASTYEAAVGSPLDAPADRFADDDGDVHELAIDAVAHAGLAVGTDPATYRPAAPVTRAQMASFLTRLLDLLVEQGRSRAPSL